MVKDCSCLWDYFMPYPFSIFMPKPHSPLFISQTKKVFSQLRFLYLLNHCLDAALHMVGQFIFIWLILKIILSERTFLATQSNRDLKLFLLLLCCIFFFWRETHDMLKYTYLFAYYISLPKTFNWVNAGTITLH